jgi:ribosomal protein RSM22 (predicted rRNA methylase)
MTLGLLAAVEGSDTRVTAVDRDASALRILERVVAALPSAPRLSTVVADVRRALPSGDHDLILAGTALNELPAGAQLPLVDALLARLAEGGALIILEPALRETARALHALRDAVVAGGRAHVFAPCTRAGSCPALDDPRDWCHEDRPFRPPPRLAALMQRTGLRTHGLKFSYLTLRKGPEPLVACEAGGRALRVVSDALDQKGTVERIVCGSEGRLRLRLLRRAGSDATRALGTARRGDVLLAASADDGAALVRIDPTRV